MQEKLWSMLRDVLKNKPNIDVVKLQKSGGVVSRNAKVRQKSRSCRIKVAATSVVSSKLTFIVYLLSFVSLTKGGLFVLEFHVTTMIGSLLVYFVYFSSQHF